MVQAKFYDIINPNKKKEPEKSGDEVVVDIVSRGGLELV